MLNEEKGKFKVLYYVNQFFGQVGGEEKAGMEPIFKLEAVGPAQGFAGLIKSVKPMDIPHDDRPCTAARDARTIDIMKSANEGGEIIGTIICGDNYFNENKEKALEFILNIVRETRPDILVAGPAFNAGRYGMACGEIANAVVDQLNIPVVTGMYIENPGVELCKDKAIVVSVASSAAGMRKALPAMANIVKKVAMGVELGAPEEEGYIPQGIRKTVFASKRGSQRAVEMLLKRLKGQEFETELPMPVFDMVEPAPPIKDLKKAAIALVTSGGMVPKGNPDKLQSASAQKWCRYDVSKKDSLQQPGSPDTVDEFCTIHGGYDPVYANKFPDRVAPLDILKKMAEQKYIGRVHDWFYTTTGTGTSVTNSVKFGKEIGAELKQAGVDGVILTST